MKQITKLVLVLSLSFLWINMNAQVPNGFNYQTVIRNANNQILVNQNIGLRISILQNSTSGNIVYSETFALATNNYGIVNLQIGSGSVLSGNFSAINWGSDLYFLKVDADFAGGTNYQFMGTSQLLSVPYALYAKQAGQFTEIDGDTTNELQLLSLSGDTLYLSKGNFVLMGQNSNYWIKNGTDIYANGDKIGIGTNNPTTKMHIKDTTFWGGPNGLLNLHGGEESSIMFQTDSLGVDQTKIILNNQSNDLEIRHAGATRLWFHENGNMSINSSWNGAKLHLYEPNSSDTTKGIDVNSNGGTAINGAVTAQTAADWLNVAINGYVDVQSGAKARAVSGWVDGQGVEGFGVFGGSDLSTGTNTGVRGWGISRAGNANWQYGGYFVSRGAWDTLQGWGTGVHYGIRAESYGGDYNCGVRGFSFSKPGNNADQLGGHFTARGDWYSDNSGSGMHYGVKAEAYGGGAWNYGIEAKAQGSSPTGNNYGGSFFGYSDVQTSGFHYGIRAQADSSTYINRGISAVATSNIGQYNQAGLFISYGTGNSTNNTENTGVYGVAQNNRMGNVGVRGLANSSLSPTAYCYGVYGEANGDGQFNEGVDGTANSNGKKNIGVGGWANMRVQADSLNYGVYAYSASADTNYGLFATSTGGYYGNGLVNYGIYAEAANASTANYAGFFEGNVTVYGNLNVTGNIAKGGGTFKIDHPADPENKYLTHSFVESPDMLNVYSGNITTDSNGIATVILPTYFEVINMDFRYQLTCIGVFAQAIIKEEVNGNQFIVQTNQPNVKVSWQVSATRNDLYAQKNRVVVEEEKSDNEKGKYLHPELYNKPRTESVHPKASNHSQEILRQKDEMRKNTEGSVAIAETEPKVEKPLMKEESKSSGGNSEETSTNPQRIR